MNYSNIVANIAKQLLNKAALVSEWGIRCSGLAIMSVSQSGCLSSSSAIEAAPRPLYLKVSFFAASCGGQSCNIFCSHIYFVTHLPASFLSLAAQTIHLLFSWEIDYKGEKQRVKETGREGRDGRRGFQRKCTRLIFLTATIFFVSCPLPLALEGLGGGGEFFEKLALPSGQFVHVSYLYTPV